MIIDYVNFVKEYSNLNWVICYAFLYSILYEKITKCKVLLIGIYLIELFSVKIEKLPENPVKLGAFNRIPGRISQE